MGEGGVIVPDEVIQLMVLQLDGNRYPLTVCVKNII